MTATLIRVDAEAYEAACAVIGDGVGASVAQAAAALIDALSASDGMAGSDAAGAAWAEGYDVAANLVVEATTDLVNACSRLAALLQQTGFNYGRAEMASVPGGTVRSAPDRSGYAERVCRLPRPPSARGASAVGTPPGWWLVEDVVGHLWPNGHQDRLHAAAAAWHTFAERLDAAADYVPRAFASIAGCAGPEVEDAERACSSMREQVLTLAAGARSVEAACTDYAHCLDEAHSAVEHELASLLAWTVVIEGTGALCSVLTLGASEAVAQAAEASRIAATAATVAAALARLGSLARASAVAVANAGYRVAGIATELRPLLTSRIVVALADGAAPLRIAESAAATSETRLAAVAARSRLGPKLRISDTQFGAKAGRHAAEFGWSPRTEAGRQLLRQRIAEIRNNPDEVRVGVWHPDGGGGVGYWFYREGADVIVIDPEGWFVTIMKDGTGNGWFRQAVTHG